METTLASTVNATPSSTPATSATAAPTKVALVKVTKITAPKAVKAPAAPKPAKVERISIFYDTEGVEMLRQPSQRGAKPAIAEVDGANWIFRNCKWITNEDGSKGIGYPEVEKAPVAKKEVFYITLDKMGNETSRELKGKGPTRKSWVKRESDGNYVELSAPIPLSQPESRPEASDRAADLSTKLAAARTENADSEAAAV